MYNDGHPSPEQVSRDYFRQNAPSAGNKSDSYEYSRGYAPRVGGYGALLDRKSVV